MEKITKQQLISKLENATNKININNNVTIKGDTLYTIIEVLKNDYSKKDMVSEDYLQNWYIDSIGNTTTPVWTPNHLEELCRDFNIYVKESIENTNE